MAQTVIKSGTSQNPQGELRAWRSRIARWWVPCGRSAGLGPRNSQCLSLSPKTVKSQHPGTDSQAGRILPTGESQPFCFIHIFSWSDEVHPYPKLPKNTHTEIPGLMFHQISGNPKAYSSWHIKLNIKQVKAPYPQGIPERASIMIIMLR